MQRLNVILSYLLILVYGVAFGHQALPHHHLDLDVNHNHHYVGTHDHCVSEKETHNHVAHEDHFDEGLFDYLACVLGAHHHNPSENCGWDQSVNGLKSTHKDQKTTLITCGVQVGVLPNIPRTLNNTFPFLSRFCGDVVLRKHGLRGPPQS